jgi:hypothetical protein
MLQLVQILGGDLEPLVMINGNKTGCNKGDTGKNLNILQLQKYFVSNTMTDVYHHVTYVH